MSENTLVYTGPLDECGFTGPVTGHAYVARPLEPFVVDPADADRLLAKWPTWLKLSVEAAPEQGEPEVQEKRRARYSKASDQETDTDQRDSDQDSES